MNGRDDFEHRLGQALKRWAQAGEPTMDLEALVRERVPLKPVPKQMGRRGSRWKPWMGGAAAAVTALALGVSLFRWTWAAAGLQRSATPAVVVHAGMGGEQASLAEVTRGGITVRILAAVANAEGTVIVYRVLGAPATGGSDVQPVAVESVVVRPAPRWPWPWGGRTGGEEAVDFATEPVETPHGYLGAISARPLEVEEAELGLVFRVGEERITVSVPVSRQDSDKSSR
ncbi:hypothetical protein J2Z79_000471 [Symbiobacterium terraclitae]|uniref:DUF4179 domain-containing protein n=1 Tax=Symbiobacterium terraclitae TaxID=557451 RepID=A0ABS4JNI5_9FIRM|nr:hypothetical protein [Symbiobacterium terraclitae]MBP2017097.1 hypothetical protein [Symbiobacterium terraclitae]